MIVRSGVFIKSLMNIRTKNPCFLCGSTDFLCTILFYNCSINWNLYICLSYKPPEKIYRNLVVFLGEHMLTAFNKVKLHRALFSCAINDFCFLCICMRMAFYLIATASFSAFFV